MVILLSLTKGDMREFSLNEQFNFYDSLPQFNI